MRKGIFFLSRAAIIALVIGAVSLFFIPLKSNKIAGLFLSPIEKKFKVELDFASSLIWVPGNISLKSVSIADKSGRLYFIDSAELNYNIGHVLFISRDFSFSLKGIKIFEEAGFFDSVADILSIPTIPVLEFDEVKGELEIRRDSVLIKDAWAANDKIRVMASGLVNNDGNLDCDVNFSFSKYITDTVPDVVKAALLKPEDGDWMGIKLKAKGNYKKPTMHITADTLRLNIMEDIIVDD